MSFGADLAEIVEENANGLLSIHETWERVPLSKVSKIINGYPFDSKLFVKNKGVPLLRIRDIFSEKTDVLYSGEIPDGYWILPGDIVIGMDGDFNCARYKGEPALLNQRVCKLEVDADFMDSRFLFYSIGGYLKAINYYTSSVTVKHLSSRTIAEIPLPFPPLNEQKRIAEKLDSLLDRVDSCQTHLERVSQILKRFRQSVLAAATSGRLTEDWRDKKRVTEEWKTTDIQSVAFVGTGSTPLRSNSNFYSSKGTPWVTSAATGQTFINSAKEFVTKEAIKAHRLKRFPIGTVIVAMYGEGKTRGQVSELAIEATINQACAAIVVDESKVEKKYLKLALQANYLEMRELAEGGNQPNLNLSKIKEFTFPLPSPEEQAELVRRVEKLFVYAERLEARYYSASEHVERLTPSLLAKAFRGALVDQEQGDEPAGMLLERVLTAKNTLAAKPERSEKSKQRRMSIMEETLEEIIQDLPKDTFSFEDLREKFSGDYETLKEQLFQLLRNENPILSQVFDKSAQAIRFVRRKK